MIRNVVIHVSNEQPLLADLYSVPTAADAGLLCTNLRMLDGKRPIFVDRTASSFFFPYHVIRFLEIDPEELAAHQAIAGRPAAEGAAPVTGFSLSRADGPVADDAERLLPVPLGPPDEDRPAGEAEGELEIDEDFLQRIRDI